MTGESLVLYCAAALALVLTPGPDMAYVVTRSLAQGRRAGLLAAAGVTAGLGAHTALVTLGLAALLAGSDSVFLAVKAAGAAYLVYLGLRTLADRQGFGPGAGHRPLPHRRLLLQGFLTNALNPKVALFFMAFLPQFTGPEAGAGPLLLMGALYALFTAAVLGALAVAAAGGRSRLLAREPVAQGLRWLSGTLLVGLGLRLALAPR